MVLRHEWLLLVGLIGLIRGDYMDLLDDEPVKGSGTSCSCGWTNRARIVGGRETKENEYPMMVVLLRASDMHQWCGGTIITPRHILTAAHCTVDKTPDDLLIAVGAHNLRKKNEATRELIKVEKIINHEKYRSVWHESNDIALLVTKDEISYNKVIGPACMPNEKLNFQDQKVKVLGWGLVADDSGQFSSALREVDLKILPHDECLNAWPSVLIPEAGSQICTYAKGKDSCQVDSGGPALWLDPDTGKYTVVGLVSYGGECAGSHPAVNTAVSYYMDWIEKEVTASFPSYHLCKKI